MEASSLALPVPKHLCDAESSLSCIFNNMARFVFRFVLGSFFHRDVFSTTSPLRFPVRSGSFRVVFECRFFVFSNFSGSFFKKGILFCF